MLPFHIVVHGSPIRGGESSLQRWPNCRFRILLDRGNYKKGLHTIPLYNTQKLFNPDSQSELTTNDAHVDIK